MKNQALFSSKDKSKKLKCRLLQFLFGPLRVKYICVSQLSHAQKLTKLKKKNSKIKEMRGVILAYQIINSTKCY